MLLATPTIVRAVIGTPPVAWPMVIRFPIARVGPPRNVSAYAALTIATGCESRPSRSVNARPSISGVFIVAKKFAETILKWTSGSLPGR